MSLGALYQADIDKALDLSASLPATPPPKPSRGIWATVGDSLRGAGARINASLLEAGKVVGAAATIDINTEESLEVLKGDPERIFRENDLSRQFREFERTLRPDPATASTAEQVVYGLVGPAAALVGGALLGGLPGVGVVSAEMGFSEAENLAREGVGLGARTGVGAVTAATNTAFAALPMMGSTLKATAGLYLAGGPGAFIAQQTASRAILEAADYSAQAQQYDPFDPTGLALSFLIPAPFAAYGAARNIRANRAAAAGEPSDVRRSASDTKQPAAAAPEQVDAAMVHNLTLMRQAQIEAEATAPFPWDQPAQPRPAAEIAIDLRLMAEGASWVTEGGRILRSGIDEPGDQSAGGFVTGRTVWTPNQEWFGRMRASLGSEGLSSQSDIATAVEKAINGERLGARQQRTVDWMRQEVADMRAEYLRADFALEDADFLTGAAFGGGLSKADATDVALTARAAQIDEAAVERAAIQFENDDAGFVAEMRRIVDGKQDSDIGASGIEVRASADLAATVYGPEFTAIEGSADSAVRNVATALRQTATDARDIGPTLMRAVSEFRAMRERGDSPDTLADRSLPPDVNNVVVGLVENARSPARVAELVRQLATATREAKANKAPTADAAADVVERMRKVLDSQVEATAKPSVEPMLKSINDRVAALEVTSPDLPVRVDDSGKVTTAKDELAAARKEAAEGTDEDIGLNEVDLVRVAAECALASGAY